MEHGGKETRAERREGFRTYIYSILLTLRTLQTLHFIFQRSILVITCTFINFKISESSTVRFVIIKAAVKILIIKPLDA